MESTRSSTRILFLDDDPERAEAFLGRHPDAVWVQTAGECIARLTECWDEVHLDHDLGGEIFVDSSRDDCGMEVVRWLCARPNEPPPETWFFVHSHNAEAAVVMVQCLRRHGYHAVYRPFGIDALEWFSEEPDEFDDAEEPEPAESAPASDTAPAPAPEAVASPAAVPVLASPEPGWFARLLRRLPRLRSTD